MNVNFERGLRGVARSFMKEICILAPGSCIPACQANWGCFSRKRVLGAGEEEDWVFASWRAIAMASEAGPKPMQRRSRISSEFGIEEEWPLRCSESISPLRGEVPAPLRYVPFEGLLTGEVLIAEGAMVPRQNMTEVQVQIPRFIAARARYWVDFVVDLRDTEGVGQVSPADFCLLNNAAVRSKHKHRFQAQKS